MITPTMPVQYEHTKVQNLMKIGEKKWDENILRDVCSDIDRELLKRQRL